MPNFECLLQLISNPLIYSMNTEYRCILDTILAAEDVDKAQALTEFIFQ